jgi:mono/diheme cytochrome c family protein
VKRRSAIIVSLTLALILGAGFVIARLTLSALEEPGAIESFLATKAKGFLIRRASRRIVLPEVPAAPADIAEGEKLYGTDCTMCHGMDGHTPTDTGLTSGAGLLGPGTVLDHKKRNQAKRHASLWQGRI